MGNGILLDTNCFAHVFNRSDKEHEDFEDFLSWLCYGPGYLVYGGSKYFNELRNTERYRKVFTLLHTYNKVLVYDSDDIDLEQERIEHIIKDPDFDDPHLPAILIVSKCRVLCTRDSRSFPFLSRKDIYEGKVKCPKFYTGNRCANLLSPTYVGKELRKIKKEQSVELADSINKVVDKF